MKRKNIKRAASRPRSRSKGEKKSKALNKQDVKQDTCTHCGGILIHDMEWSRCVMCGRAADHHCERCLGDSIAA